MYKKDNKFCIHVEVLIVHLNPSAMLETKCKFKFIIG